MATHVSQIEAYSKKTGIVRLRQGLDFFQAEIVATRTRLKYGKEKVLLT